MYACICAAVPETEVGRAIAAGAHTEDEVTRACGAGSGCGSCLDRICDMIQAVSTGLGPRAAVPA